MPDERAPSENVEPAVVDELVAQHRRFLQFLERRVGSREDAEEILQEAFVRSIARGDTLRERESATAWFYRLLRNAVIDHWRRRDAEHRATERVAREPEEEPPAPDEDLMDAVCRCVEGLVDTLPDDQARAIREVDLAGRRVADFADDAGITANNASVRLHRARRALRRRVERSCGTCATHGCLDCTCEHAPAS